MNEKFNLYNRLKNLRLEYKKNPSDALHQEILEIKKQLKESLGNYLVFNRLNITAETYPSFQDYLNFSEIERKNFDKKHPGSSYRERLTGDNDYDYLLEDQEELENIRKSKELENIELEVNNYESEKQHQEDLKKIRQRAFKKGLDTANKTIQEDLKQGDYSNIERYKRLCKSKRVPLEVKQAYKTLLNNNGINVGN